MAENKDKMDAISKFTVASEQGLDILFTLKEAKFRGMYSQVARVDELEQFIIQQLDHRKAMDELNALGNQLIILYVKNRPAGFAITKQTGHYPAVLKGKRVLHYAFFYILPEFDNIQSRTSLWQKCLSISKTQDAVWMEVLQNDTLLPFFESCGFAIHERSVARPFDQPSYILIRYKDNVLHPQ